MTTPIALEHLSKRFGATTAVDDVSLDVGKGQMFFLLGPSGCGKTTLLRMIAGFTEPTKGAIRFGKRDVTKLPPDKRNAGMVFQSYALWPHMTVAENVEFGLKARKVPRDQRKLRVAQALALVQMEPYAERKPGQLSGGQQQRVALARALVVEPDVLLLDEPLSNLDAKLRNEMRVEIKRACVAAGVTSIYVTHDQKEALSMADEMAVMRDGQMLQRGAPRDLYERPTTQFVANFLGPTNFLKGSIIEHKGLDLTIQTAAGALTATLPEGAAIPDTKDVTCLLRPEVLTLAPAAPTPGATPPPPGAMPDRAAAGMPNTPSATNTSPTKNTLTGRYAESVYLGETTQHTVDLHDDHRVTFFEFNPAARLHAGEQIKLHVDPRNVVVLTK
ncbi:MAG: ABC transporter ATP-binding protein [Phycisphaerales bacterium]|nr:MAG: ABC transporter ATP-binding protein [Phycisphaerales bacterium]